MLNSGDLKQKYILRRGENVFIPCVEWFEWPVWVLPTCNTCLDAQAVLALYPSDCYDGYLSNLESENNEHVDEEAGGLSYPLFE